MVRSQVRRGRPERRLQSLGNPRIDVYRALDVSCESPIRATCPKKRSLHYSTPKSQLSWFICRTLPKLTYIAKDTLPVRHELVGDQCMSSVCEREREKRLGESRKRPAGCRKSVRPMTTNGRKFHKLNLQSSKQLTLHFMTRLYSIQSHSVKECLSTLNAIQRHYDAVIRLFCSE